MTVLAQFSQRATCPPSAIVRQRSMADITFIWSRLTCPALALRHAAPWSRKISATSNAGRDTAAAAMPAAGRAALKRDARGIGAADRGRRGVAGHQLLA